MEIQIDAVLWGWLYVKEWVPEEGLTFSGLWSA